MHRSDSLTLLTSLRPVQGRIDYNNYNYCAQCEYKLPKDFLRCPECKQKVRTRALASLKTDRHEEDLDDPP